MIIGKTVTLPMAEEDQGTRASQFNEKDQSTSLRSSERGIIDQVTRDMVSEFVLLQRFIFHV